jgi:hypothetical protein
MGPPTEHWKRRLKKRLSIVTLIVFGWVMICRGVQRSTVLVACGHCGCGFGVAV